MNRGDCLQIVQSYRQRGSNLISYKPRARMSLVEWRDSRLNDENFLCFQAEDVRRFGVMAMSLSQQKKTDNRGRIVRIRFIR